MKIIEPFERQGIFDNGRKRIAMGVFQLRMYEHISFLKEK